MKIITSPIPDWFYSSKLFNLETNQNDKNYNSPKGRIHDYENYPSYSAPSNKIVAHGEYDYSLIKSQENNSLRYDPGQKVGYNVFPKLNGLLPTDTQPFFNAYDNSKQIAFKNEGGTLNDNTLNLGAGTDEKWQWINGEQGIGYNVDLGDTTKISRLNNFLNQARANQPNANFTIYSLPAFQVWDLFYQSMSNLNSVNTLVNYLTNPPDSIMALGGFDYLMEDLYSVGSSETQFYGALGIYLKQLARKKYQLTNTKTYSKLHYLLWSHSEFFGYQFRYRKNTGEFINCGELDGLSKAPSNLNHNYNVALAGVTLADGFYHFIDRFPTFGTVNINGTNRDLELENINHSTSATLRGQYYNVGPAIIWLGANQYSALAIWHGYLNKDIIEDTTYDWFTPNFIYNNVLRNSIYKTIPYNMFYKEPTLEVKYSANKEECLIYACNFVNTSTTPQVVTAIVKDKNNNDVNIPIVLKGTKAELVRVRF